LTEAQALFQATVTWDEAAFAFVEAAPLGSIEYFGGDPGAGWMMVQSSRSALPDGGRLTLVFRALDEAATTSFAADAGVYFEERDARRVSWIPP
jgi:hypothetical protein